MGKGRHGRDRTQKAEKGWEGDERRTAEGGKSGWRVRNDVGGFVGGANKCFLQHKTHAFVLKPNIERIWPSCRED